MNKQFCLSFVGTKGKTREILAKMALDQLVALGFCWNQHREFVFDRNFTEKCINRGSEAILISYHSNPLFLDSGNIGDRKAYSVLTEYNEFIAEAQKLVQSIKSFTITINVEVSYVNGQIEYDDVAVDKEILKVAGKKI